MNNPNLPEEILIEIFSRLPAKSVGKCRCLSKSWRTNLSTSQFVNYHLKRTTDQKDAILVTRSRCLHTIKIPVDGSDKVVSRKLDLPPTFESIVDSCNGLVMLLGTVNREILVVNPLTMQQVSIPNTPEPVDKVPGYTTTYSYGFGYDSCSDDYKIVKLSIDIFTGTTSVDVYSLKSAVWKRVDDSPYDHEDLNHKRDDGVFFNGAIHWLALNKDGRYMIAAFDVATESFHEIPVPNDKLDESLPYSLYGITDCLLMLYNIYYDTLDMWIMKEYGRVNSCTNFSSVRVSAFDEDGCAIKPLCFVGENEVVFITEKGTLLVWNLTEGTTKDIIDNGALSVNDGGHMFLESLVSPIQYNIAT